MCFDLDHRRLDSRRFVDGQKPVQVDVRQSNGPASATVHKALHRPPGIEQSHLAVVNDIAVLIPRILLLPRLKRKWSVNEVEIQIVEPEPVETCLESRFHALGPMIGIPQFCGDEEVLACNASTSNSCLQGLAHLTLVPISFRAIEVSKSGFERGGGGTYRYGCIGDQGAKSECGYMAGSVTERYFCSPKIGGFDHDQSLNGN